MVPLALAVDLRMMKESYREGYVHRTRGLDLRGKDQGYGTGFGISTVQLSF